jgi:TIR domain
MDDILIQRFEHYFRHPDWGHDVLRPGDRAIACRNIRAALSWLDPASDDLTSEANSDIYDESLKIVVRKLQSTYQHRVADGLVGPGTRRLLVSEILHKGGPSIFQRLFRPEQRQLACVFISYAQADADKVDKLDQWLRDHGIQVIRDTDYFVAGVSIRENIAQALSVADKIVAVLSRNSRDRVWPLLEREMAEQVESRIGTSMLIYVCLDDTSLPAHDPERLAIPTKDIALKEVGERILYAVTGTRLTALYHPYDENKPL